MRYYLYKLLFILIITGIALSACSNHQQKKKIINRKTLEESLIKANKQLVKGEAKEINDFIRSKDWNMHETGSGLRYMIYSNGKGRKTKTGDKVKLEYTLSLINGDTIESSKSSGYLSFVAGRGDAIQGLHEAVLLMQQGDEAKLVVPSHLAYGLTGVPGKVPAKAILVYDIKLITVSK